MSTPRAHYTQPVTFSPFIQGERFYLRGVRPTDINDTYHRWLSDTEVTKFLESRFFPSSIESLTDYVTRTTSDPEQIFLAIILRDGDTHVGNVKIGPIDWIHRFADVGIMLGEKSIWGQGIATEVLRLVVDYAFKKLNLHRLTAGIYASNPGSTRAFEKAGFAVEGVRKSHRFYDGKYIDELMLGIVRPNSA